MYTSLGAMLTALRKARRLSQSQAAQAAQISRVTLTRWETNVQTPRLADLNLLLSVLQPTPAQQHHILELLESPGARKQTQALVAQISERMALTEMPHGGLLLQAMRSRCGLTLEETAARIGVTSRTLRRWERGEVWPETKALHTLCHTLGAHEEEVIALTCGMFAPQPPLAAKPLSREQLMHEIKTLEVQCRLGSHSLTELQTLTLQTQAWTFAVRSGGERLPLITLSNVYTDYLYAQKRHEEARRSAAQTLELHDQSSPSPLLGLGGRVRSTVRHAD